MGRSRQHNAESIKREISAIIRELKDPRLKKHFISIVKIEVSSKNSSFKVFISALDGLEVAIKATKYLNSAVGFIRKQLGERITLRYIPSIVFIPTDSIEYGTNILKKIDEISEKT